MSYLARLKRLLAENRSPEELTELTKGASVSFVSEQGNPISEREGAFVSSASDRCRDVLGDDGADAGAPLGAIEERAGLAADSVPAVYLDAWAQLNHQKPYGVSEADWRQALDDGGRFLDAFGSEAAKLGWAPCELFEVTGGLVWRLAGERVEAIGADHVRLSEGRTMARASDD